MAWCFVICCLALLPKGSRSTACGMKRRAAGLVRFTGGGQQRERERSGTLAFSQGGLGCLRDMSGSAFSLDSLNRSTCWKKTLRQKSRVRRWGNFPTVWRIRRRGGVRPTFRCLRFYSLDSRRRAILSCVGYFYRDHKAAMQCKCVFPFVIHPP